MRFKAIANEIGWTQDVRLSLLLEFIDRMGANDMLEIFAEDKARNWERCYQDPRSSSALCAIHGETPDWVSGRGWHCRTYFRND